MVLHVAQEHADVLDDPPCDVIFIGFGDSSLDFELRIWTSKQVTTPKIIASDIYFKLFAAFTEEGIEIPYPQRDVHLRSVSQPVRVEALHADGRTRRGENRPPVYSRYGFLAVFFEAAEEERALDRGGLRRVGAVNRVSFDVGSV